MLLFVLYLAGIVLVAIVSSIITKETLLKRGVGNLVIRHSADEDQPYIFLEINKGRMDDITPGNIVMLNVTRE